MVVEIKEVAITEDEIIITATNLEDYILAEDLFKEIDPAPVNFCFHRHARNGAEMRYLYKIVASQRKCQAAKSMGAKLQLLCGVITTLADGFRVKS